MEAFARLPLERLSLSAMLAADPRAALASARAVQRELPRRLARRLLDLQLLPYVVVSNPHIKRVYHAYWHAFDTLRRLPEVADAAGDAALRALLTRLLAEHAPLLDALAAGAAAAEAAAFADLRVAAACCLHASAAAC